MGSEMCIRDSYRYDEEDLLTYKKIPSAEPVLYAYNNLDLLGGYQDGFLSNLNQWYTYDYDSYGREIEQGFFNGSPSTNFAPSDPQITTIYGTSLHERDKVKRVETKILGTNTELYTQNTYATCGMLIRQDGNNHLNTSNSANLNIYSVSYTHLTLPTKRIV